MTGRSARLESANFERAEIAVRWEDASDRASKTGLVSDQLEAARLNRALEAADRLIKAIEAEPGPTPVR